MCIRDSEYTNSIGTHWVVVAIKNNSEFNLEISMDGQFKDANGTLIGTSKDEDPAFEKGSEIAFTFNNEAEYASFEYKISVEETDYYDCVWSNIQVESNTAEKKAIISATNNGEKPAEFLEYIVVFFNGGTPAVSYTHLDVYKRQIWNRPRIRPCFTNGVFFPLSTN